MINDYYLSAPTEAAMQAAIAELPEGVAVHVIGVWSNYDPATETSTPVPGYHFNARSTAPLEVPAGITSSSPVTPWCVWG